MPLERDFKYSDGVTVHLDEKQIMHIIDTFGVNNLGSQGFKTAARAIWQADQDGIPQDYLLGILWAENKFNVDGGNNGGPGQMLASTAQGLKLDPGKLKSDTYGVMAASKYAKQNLKTFNGDQRKATASYFLGPGTIQAAEKGGGDWLKNADVLAQQYHQGTASQYLNNTKTTPAAATGTTTRDDLHGMSADDILKQNGLKGAGSATPSTSIWSGGPPRPQDFYITNSDGSQSFDIDSYTKASNAYVQQKELDLKTKDDNLTPYKQYVDDVIQELSLGIQSGSLNEKKASDLLQARSSFFKTALDSMNGDAFKYAAPTGAQYVPGREPGGLWESRGLAPLKADQSMPFDPMSWAQSQVNQTQSDLNNVQAPDLSSALGGFSGPDAINRFRASIYQNNTAAPPSTVPGPYAGSTLPAPPAQIDPAAMTTAEQILRQSMGGN